jgi:hypothetical protein
VIGRDIVVTTVVLLGIVAVVLWFEPWLARRRLIQRNKLAPGQVWRCDGDGLTIEHYGESALEFRIDDIGTEHIEGQLRYGMEWVPHRVPISEWDSFTSSHDMRLEGEPV